MHYHLPGLEGIIENRGGTPSFTIAPETHSKCSNNGKNTFGFYYYINSTTTLKNNKPVVTLSGLIANNLLIPTRMHLLFEAMVNQRDFFTTFSRSSQVILTTFITQ